MEYKTDKRTKNLTLRDLRIGDWVQAWSDVTERYSPPMKVSSIHYDGTVYLVPDDDHHCDPWEEDIKDIDALPITPDLLKGFGFECKKDELGNTELYHNGEKILCCFLETNCMGERYISDGDFNLYYFFHEFIDIIPGNTKIEWEGIGK